MGRLPSCGARVVTREGSWAIAMRVSDDRIRLALLLLPESSCRSFRLVAVAKSISSPEPQALTPSRFASCSMSA